MNERLLHNVLDTGLAYFTADPDRLETYLQNEQGMSAADTAKIRAYFEMSPEDGEAGGPPNVIHGYPRSTGPFPCWALLLMADTSKQRMLGDDAGTMDDLDDEVDLDGVAAIPLVRLADYTIAIDVCVPYLPDICEAYYHLLRHIIFKSVQTLQGSPNYLQNVEFSGGDLAPQQQYLPEYIWIRRLTVTFFVEEAAWESKTVPTSIGGAYSDTETTGVTGGITTYEAES